MSTWSEVSLLLLSPAMSQVIQLQVTSKKTKAAIDWTWLTTFSRINFQLCSCTYSHNYYTSIYVCMCVYTLAFNAFCSICGIPYLLHSRCHVQSVHNGLSLLYGCASFKINNPPEQQCCDVGCAVLVYFFLLHRHFLRAATNVLVFILYRLDDSVCSCVVACYAMPQRRQRSIWITVLLVEYCTNISPLLICFYCCCC